MDIQHAIMEKIRLADRAGANQLLDEWAAVNGYQRMLEQVIEPALALAGQYWIADQSMSLAQCYVAARIAEDSLKKIAATAGAQEPAQPGKGPIVLGNIEDDFHALGRGMVATFLRTDGWMVHDLGNDVPAGTFVDTAQKVGARIIGVSAMMHSTARNIGKLRQEIDRRGLTGEVQLAVGGAIFIACPELVDEVGGDGTAVNAMGAADLCRRLWVRATGKEPRP